ncbi:hypothetical protein IHE45_14G013100 [Dioscorea alata]|uniref:Uncharacterized protein n=1 Tax=Dioscorea alata TaxID=55571 RepID=A0ACB7UQ74_DIOAL|nr:hypothetical protein IHE45_14G013100 [Dioscorea alata]
MKSPLLLIILVFFVHMVLVFAVEDISKKANIILDGEIGKSSNRVDLHGENTGGKMNPNSVTAIDSTRPDEPTHPNPEEREICNQHHELPFCKSVPGS